MRTLISLVYIPWLFCIAEFLFIDSEQIGRWPDRLKILQQRDLIFLHPHHVVIVRTTRPPTTRERLAVRGKGPTHILADSIDRIAEVQGLLPFALGILVGDPHIMSASRPHVRARTGDNEALPIP